MNKISTLYKIDDTVVFYSLEDTYILAELVKNGTTFLNVFGEEIDKDAANFEYAILTGQFRPRNDLERIYRNIQMADVIVAIVRKELLDKDNGLEYLTKLQPAIELANVGMFNDASAYILSLVPDDILTDAQLNRWSDLLLSSNSIEDI